MKERTPNKILISSIIALVAAVTMTISMCIAWFAYNTTIRTGMDLVVVARPFALGHIKIEVDEEKLEINEFTGLLPGSTYVFEIELNRKVAGQFYFELSFLGIKGEEFIGKLDKKVHNMTELFCVTPIDSKEKPLGDRKFFSENTEGILPLYSGYSMDFTVDSVLVFFKLEFSSDVVPLKELPIDISKKTFDIGNIYVDTI